MRCGPAVSEVAVSIHPSQKSFSIPGPPFSHSLLHVQDGRLTRSIGKSRSLSAKLRVFRSAYGVLRSSSAGGFSVSFRFRQCPPNSLFSLSALLIVLTQVVVVERAGQRCDVSRTDTRAGGQPRPSQLSKALGADHYLPSCFASSKDCSH